MNSISLNSDVCRYGGRLVGLVNASGYYFKASLT